jgi:hypothetical protein
VGPPAVFPLPEVEEALEGDVEEVSGAAGGIEDADGGELIEPGGEEAFGLGVGGEEGFCGGPFRGGTGIPGSHP